VSSSDFGSDESLDLLAFEKPVSVSKICFVRGLVEPKFPDMRIRDRYCSNGISFDCKTLTPAAFKAILVEVLGAFCIFKPCRKICIFLTSLWIVLRGGWFVSKSFCFSYHIIKLIRSYSTVETWTPSLLDTNIKWTSSIKGVYDNICSSQKDVTVDVIASFDIERDSCSFESCNLSWLPVLDELVIAVCRATIKLERNSTNCFRVSSTSNIRKSYGFCHCVWFLCR
jgi:hypothetical protein